MNRKTAILGNASARRETFIQFKVAMEAEVEWLALHRKLRRYDAVASFLRYARRNIPFYSHQPEFRDEELRSFPVAQRSQYHSSPDSFLASSIYKQYKYLCAFTNGTLGTQLKIQFSPAAWYEINYGTYAAVARVIPGLMEKVKPGMTGVILISNSVYQEPLSLYIPTLQHSLLHQLVLGRSPKTDEGAVKYLRKERIPLLYGKAFTLMELARLDAHLSSPMRRIRPHAILVSGETLYEDQRSRLESWFGCPVYNAYIATEGGLMALECRYRAGLHLREEMVRAEILDKQGKIRSCGKGEILITNLVNRAHVFVRYRLGDQVEIQRLKCRCGFTGRSIVKVLGRETDAFTFSEGRIKTRRFERFLLELPLKEFQVSQIEDSMPVLKWVPEDLSASNIGSISREIQRWLEQNDWQDQVSSVPLTAITPACGKHRRFVKLPAPRVSSS